MGNWPLAAYKEQHENCILDAKKERNDHMIFSCGESSPFSGRCSCYYTKADEAWGLPSSFIRLGKAALHIRIES